LRRKRGGTAEQKQQDEREDHQSVGSQPATHSFSILHLGKMGYYIKLKSEGQVAESTV
jgi:hypothetical protein